MIKSNSSLYELFQNHGWVCYSHPDLKPSKNKKSYLCSIQKKPAKSPWDSGTVVTQTVEQNQKANAADAPRNGQVHRGARSPPGTRLGCEQGKGRGWKQANPAGGIVLFVMPTSLHKWLNFPRSLKVFILSENWLSYTELRGSCNTAYHHPQYYPSV